MIHLVKKILTQELQWNFLFEPHEYEDNLTISNYKSQLNKLYTKSINQALKLYIISLFRSSQPTPQNLERRCVLSEFGTTKTQSLLIKILDSLLRHTELSSSQ
jgi:hypothetical protein